MPHGKSPHWHQRAAGISRRVAVRESAVSWRSLSKPVAGGPTALAVAPAPAPP
jgi:hypothetical protein